MTSESRSTADAFTDPRVVAGAGAGVDGPRVGVLLWDDAHGPQAISGMPWNMRHALARAGCEIVPISVGRSGAAPIVGPAGVVGRWNIARRAAFSMRNAAETALGDRVRRHQERLARDSARTAERAARDLGVDAVFGPCMSRPLACFEGDRPVVYASDATAALLVTTYDRYRERGAGWRRAMLDLETRALARADRVALASERTTRSAIEDHGVDPAKVSIVPLGANVHPGDEGVEGTPAPPDRGDLRLLLTASDPERKQLPLCIEVVQELGARGWNATLQYIGPDRLECRRPEVSWVGALSLKRPADTAIHRRLLRDCHLAILPSLAEMYGIAPIESAAFGRPAVVSDAGGLPTVVKDGETGRVVPLGTPVAGWADAVEAICACPTRYAAYSQAARARQAAVLNWDAWGRSVRGLIDAAVAGTA